MAEYPALMLWTDAYLADTTHLSAEEHGVYLLLLMAAWRTPDCSLPDDDDRLARMARVGLKKWRQVRAVMEQFWTVENKCWTQKRLLKERARSDMLRSRQSDAGKASALKRKETPPTSVTTKDPTKIQPPLPSPLPREEESKNLSLVKGARCARKVKAFDFGKPENRQAYARQKMAAFLDPLVLMAAEDPASPNHAEAVELARAAAKRAEVMWVPPNVTPMRKASA